MPMPSTVEPQHVVQFVSAPVFGSLAFSCLNQWACVHCYSTGVAVALVVPNFQSITGPRWLEERHQETARQSSANSRTFHGSFSGVDRLFFQAADQLRAGKARHQSIALLVSKASQATVPLVFKAVCRNQVLAHSL
jgi:hypothetical protein